MLEASDHDEEQEKKSADDYDQEESEGVGVRCLSRGRIRPIRDKREILRSLLEKLCSNLLHKVLRSLLVMRSFLTI